jgi:hypothetical protein
VRFLVSKLTLSLVVVTSSIAACSAQKPPPAVAPTVTADGPRESSDGLTVSGLRGTLTEREISAALEPRMPRFLRCVATRLGALEVLSGEIALAFHVATDGAVVAVHPRSSTLGDRETERCIVEVAKATRFPPPHGGEADFSWPLEVPVDPDVRAPVALDADQVRSQLGEQAEALVAACGGGPFAVTAYIERDGSPSATGVAAPDGATDPELDCIAEGVRAWRFAPAGSYVAKLSFSMP